MSYFEQVAKMLGVEIGEEFKITTYGNILHKFEDDGLYFTNDGKLWTVAPFSLYELLNKKANIVESTNNVAWNPKGGDTYWTIEHFSDLINNERDKSFNNQYFINQYFFSNTDIDMSRSVMELCFRTKEEAIEALPLVKAKVKRVLDGGKWEEEDE